MRNKNERFLKIVGRISKDITEKYNIPNYEGKEIVQDLSLAAHANKHRKEFKNDKSYFNTLENIEKILETPFFVYYDPHKNSLLYFKKIDEDVCAVVQLNLRKNKDIYVATVYPISQNKIKKYKEKSYILNR